MQKNGAARGVMNCARVGPGAPHRENVRSSFELQTAVGRVVCTCVLSVCVRTPCGQGLGKRKHSKVKKKKEASEVCAFEGLQVISGGWKTRRENERQGQKGGQGPSTNSKLWGGTIPMFCLVLPKNSKFQQDLR